MSHADVIIKVIAFPLLGYRAEELRGVTVVWHKVAERGHSSKELMARWPFSSGLPPLDTGRMSVRILSLGLFLELPQGSTCHSSLDSYSWPPCHILKGDEFCSDVDLPFRPSKAPSPSCHIAPAWMIRQQCLMGQEMHCHVCPQSSPLLSLVPFSSPPFFPVTQSPSSAWYTRFPGWSETISGSGLQCLHLSLPFSVLPLHLQLAALGNYRPNTHFVNSNL